jgi:hypothetical protein
VVVSILETTTLEEHRKVYRQIQDRTFLHHIRAIGHPGKDADVIETISGDSWLNTQSKGTRHLLLQKLLFSIIDGIMSPLNLPV